MADLQEALAAREKRSRLLTVIVGVAVVIILGLIVFAIVSGNGDGEETAETGATQQEEEQQEEQAEGNGDEPVAGGVDLDSLFDGQEEQDTSGEEEATDPSEQTDESNTEADTQAGTGDDSDLPNTGPVENAMIGILALGILGGLYAQSRSKLSEARK